MPVIYLLIELVAGKNRLFGIDHDDIVAAIHVRRISRFVLAAQARHNNRGEAADHKPFGVDQNPLLLDVRRLCGIGFHCHPLRVRRKFQAGKLPAIKSCRDRRPIAMRGNNPQIH